MLFNERYKKFHIGNICETGFKEMWSGDRYWEVMNYLAGPSFNAQKMARGTERPQCVYKAKLCL